MKRWWAWLGLAAVLLLHGAGAAAFTIEVPDFGTLERQLRLKPLQKAQFEIAVKASQRALMSVALAGLKVKERVSAELAKPYPDLEALYRVHEQAYEMAAPNFRDARLEWERMYALLDRAQVAALRRFLQDQLGFLAPARD